MTIADGLGLERSYNTWHKMCDGCQILLHQLVGLYSSDESMLIHQEWDVMSMKGLDSSSAT